MGDIVRFLDGKGQLLMARLAAKPAGMAQVKRNVDRGVIDHDKETLE
ncbi:hypothetical protein JCM19236_998 [Vibrio sp. JCM 19236]|nr:hypothetical protein JCM19236_998 [Vibrio sp. JCM 19236]